MGSHDGFQNPTMPHTVVSRVDCSQDSHHASIQDGFQNRTLAAKARLPSEAPRVSSGVQAQMRREAATHPDACKH